MCNTQIAVIVANEMRSEMSRTERTEKKYVTHSLIA